MTPQEARYILHQTAKEMARDGLTPEDFIALLEFSPTLVSGTFAEAARLEGDKADHIVSLVWTPTQHCG